MSSKTKRIVAILVIVMFCLVFVLPLVSMFAGHAAPTTIEEAQKNTKTAAEKLKTAQKEREESEKRLEQINKDIAAIQKDITATEGKITALDKEIANLQNEIDEANVMLAEKNELYDHRIQYIVENANADMLEIVFEAESISDMLNRYEVINQVLEFDQVLIDEIETARALVEEKKEISEEAKTKRQTELDNSVKKKAKHTEKKTEGEKEQKVLAQREKECQENYTTIKAEEEDLKRKIASATKASTVKYSGGKFGWPVAGSVSVSSGFGMRYHPILRVNKLHTGTDFPVSSGSAVYAAGDGRVIMSGWNNAYGNYIIIDHGGGFATLYAHGSSLVAKSGASVKRGQLIMYSGNTGYSTGPHLHFEVLINGKAVNAMNYL